MKTRMICAAVLVLVTGCTRNEGQKVGTLTKVAKEGMFRPTWEAELVKGGMTGGQSAVFDFTIQDDASLKLAQQALDSGKEIKVSYFTTMPQWCPLSSEGPCIFASKIELVQR